MREETFDVTDVEEIIRKKRDIRKFKPEPISDKIILKILEAGRLSQSSKNSQPWHFIVIKDKAKIQKLSENTYSGDFLKDAPLAIAVISHNAKLESDLGRCVQNMMLVAWKYKIGSVWITNFWEKAKDILNVPMTPNYKLITVIPFGYIPVDLQVVKGKKKRKQLSEIAHLESFGSPLI